MNKINHWLIVLLLCCTTFIMVSCTSPKMAQELGQGKRDFEEGYFKKSFKELLPLAVKGNAEAQYAVGYMYYYGYGVTQDAESGAFWIRQSAEQHYQPAIKALPMLNQSHYPKTSPPDATAEI